MNQAQKDYAMTRITDIVKERTIAIRKKHVTPAKTLNSEAKLALVRSGKVKIKSGHIDPHGYFLSAFDFSKFESPEKIDQDALTKELKKMNADAAAVRDEIMLGDEEKAKALIAKFAAA